MSEGVLFCKGLQLTAFIILQSLLILIPRSIKTSDNISPDLPMNGTPLASSFLPGASPTINIFFSPFPDTFIFGVIQFLYNPQRSHPIFLFLVFVFIESNVSPDPKSKNERLIILIFLSN